MATIKGVVLERKGNKVTVLTDSGEFKEFSHSGPVDVGEMIVKRVYGEYGIYAAAVLMLFLITTQMVSFMTVSAYAQVEINPRIELGINRFDRVVSTASINADGERVLNQVFLKGMKTENAIGSIVAEARKEGYLNKLNNQITVTTIPLDNKGLKVARVIQQTLEKDKNFLNDSGANEPNLQVFRATVQQREKARKSKESLGKMLRQDKRMDISTPDWDRTVRDNEDKDNKQETTEVKNDGQDTGEVSDKPVLKYQHEDQKNGTHAPKKHKLDKVKIDKSNGAVEAIEHYKPDGIEKNVPGDNSGQKEDKGNHSQGNKDGAKNKDVKDKNTSPVSGDEIPIQSTKGEKREHQEDKDDQAHPPGQGAKR
ncbi:MAG: anti-sigma factor domain-containing protein [Acidobacteriota bacterium]